MKSTLFTIVFLAAAALAGWLTTVTYQAFLVETNVEIAQCQLGMTLSLAAMSLAYLMMPVLMRKSPVSR